MIEAMRQANLEPPRFHDKRSSFWVVFRSHSLMDPESAMWLQQFADASLNDRQRLALVYLRHNERMANDDYRRLNRVDASTATSLSPICAAEYCFLLPGTVSIFSLSGGPLPFGVTG